MESSKQYVVDELDHSRQIVISGLSGNCPKQFRFVKRYWDNIIRRCKDTLVSATPACMSCRGFGESYFTECIVAGFEFLFLTKSDGKYYLTKLNNEDSLAKINKLLNNRINVKNLLRSTTPPLADTTPPFSQIPESEAADGLVQLYAKNAADKKLSPKKRLKYKRKLEFLLATINEDDDDDEEEEEEDDQERPKKRAKTSDPEEIENETAEAKADEGVGSFTDDKEEA